MASMHSSCFLALKWLHFLRSKPLAASTASFASSPASYSAWMQHCVITAVQEGRSARRTAEEEVDYRFLTRTRFDGALQNVVQAGHDVHLLGHTGSDEFGIGFMCRIASARS